MNILADRTGFPLVDVKELGLINLWPVTKVQLERFMADTNTLGDRWYESLLSLNCRASCRHFDRNDYEKVFITGITPQEALRFANWLGDGFDLPTLEEWRRFYRIIRTRSLPDSPNSSLSVDASSIWLNLRSGKTPVDFALMRHGLVEWVRRGDKYTGVGKPRDSFLRNAYDPLEDEVDPISERVFCFGFRLIRRRES